MHCSRRKLLRRGLEFHACTINKSAHTKMSGNLSYAPRIFVYMYTLLNTHTHTHTHTHTYIYIYIYIANAGMLMYTYQHTHTHTHTHTHAHIYIYIYIYIYSSVFSLLITLFFTSPVNLVSFLLSPSVHQFHTLLHLPSCVSFYCINSSAFHPIKCVLCLPIFQFSLSFKWFLPELIFYIWSRRFVLRQQTIFLIISIRQCWYKAILIEHRFIQLLVKKFMVCLKYPLTVMLHIYIYSTKKIMIKSAQTHDSDYHVVGLQVN